MDIKTIQSICEMAKKNNIKTIEELAMYCKVWEITNQYELIARLSLDCFEIVYEEVKKGGGDVWKQLDKSARD